MEENVGCCGILQTCCHRPNPEKDIIEGTFVINHSPWLCLSAAGRSVVIWLYSSEKVDPGSEIEKGLESEKAYLMQGKMLDRKKLPPIEGKMKVSRRVIIKFKLKFEVVKGFGPPGAFVIENRGNDEFFLKSATLHYSNVPGATNNREDIHFCCGSWVYPLEKTRLKRVFFSKQLCLPSKTPRGLKELRKKELKQLRSGESSKGERKPWDRVYEYDYYNDLGDPDNDPQYARPILGGSPNYPYPRRLRTGRSPCHQDHLTESRSARLFQTYVPPDERLSHEKQEELRKNFVDALVRFLTPKVDQPPRSFQECPDLVKKIVRFFVPNAALSPGDFGIIQSIVDFFTINHKSSSQQDTRSTIDPINVLFDIFSEKQVKEIDVWVKKKLKKLIPKQIFNEVVAEASKIRNLDNSQLPSIIEEDKFAWIEEIEFGRQMLAGTNPVRIRRVKFSPKPEYCSYRYSILYFLHTLYCEDIIPKESFISIINEFEERVIGFEDDHNKTKIISKTFDHGGWMNKSHPDSGKQHASNDEEEFVDVSKALRYGEAFILEHDNYLLPFLDMINRKGVCAYATQTVLVRGSTFDTLEPVVIVLQLPNQDPDRNMIQKTPTAVFPIPQDFFRWQLAKFHVAANDSAYHQLVSHWLHTHAVIEPFIIATRRQLSVMHPIHSLLDPHFKDTLHINALARGIFLNAGGILETTLFTGEYSMRLSSHLYKDWRFEDQALPKDLEKRGMANIPVKKSVQRDENAIELDPAINYTKVTRVELNLKDYPYAEDGLEIWDAIETWVKEFCQVYYITDDDVKEDSEIKEWWKEIRTVGHSDQKEGWYDLITRENLIKALTTIIWIASGLHAAVNFGQYAYAGWPLNRPMLLRKFIPDAEDIDRIENPEKFISDMLPEKFEMEFVVAVMDILSRHTSDEVYLGQKPPQDKWEDSGNEHVDDLFKKFKRSLEKIEKDIMERNKDYKLMNRWGPARIPYKLLYPDTSKENAPTKKGEGQREGIIGRGIPNSISI